MMPYTQNVKTQISFFLLRQSLKLLSISCSTYVSKPVVWKRISVTNSNEDSSLVQLALSLKIYTRCTQDFKNTLNINFEKENVSLQFWPHINVMNLFHRFQTCKYSIRIQRVLTVLYNTESRWISYSKQPEEIWRFRNGYYFHLPVMGG